MNYYKLDIKPHLNGASKSWLPKDFWKKTDELNIFRNNHQNLSNFILGKIPEFELELEGVLIEKHAKLTDFISIGALLRGFAVSDKVRIILQEYILPKHKFYPITFYQLGKADGVIHKINGYWWFYFELEFGENINFEKSEFDYEEHRYSSRIEKPVDKISTLEEYESIFYATGVAVRATKLVLKPSFKSNLDVWGCRFLSLESYFSEKLVKRFKKEKISGFDLKEPRCELIFESTSVPSMSPVRDTDGKCN